MGIGLRDRYLNSGSVLLLCDLEHVFYSIVASISPFIKLGCYPSFRNVTKMSGSLLLLAFGLHFCQEPNWQLPGPNPAVRRISHQQNTPRTESVGILHWGCLSIYSVCQALGKSLRKWKSIQNSLCFKELTAVWSKITTYYRKSKQLINKLGRRDKPPLQKNPQ